MGPSEGYQNTLPEAEEQDGENRCRRTILKIEEYGLPARSRGARI